MLAVQTVIDFWAVGNIVTHRFAGKAELLPELCSLSLIKLDVSIDVHYVVVHTGMRG